MPVNSERVGKINSTPISHCLANAFGVLRFARDSLSQGITLGWNSLTPSAFCASLATPYPRVLPWAAICQRLRRFALRSRLLIPGCYPGLELANAFGVFRSPESLVEKNIGDFTMKMKQRPFWDRPVCRREVGCVYSMAI